MSAFLSEVASANPWSILGWLVVASVGGVAGYAGVIALMDWWRNSKFRKAGA